MPNIRLGWQATPDIFLWSAVSRAIRTPSRIDRELESPGLLAPSPNFQSEKLTAYEVGYRGQPTPRSSLSVSAFYNVYSDLRTDALTNGGLPIVLMNGLAGDTYGVEAWATYSITDWWRLKPGVNWLHKNLTLNPGATDFSGAAGRGPGPALSGAAPLGNQPVLDGRVRHCRARCRTGLAFDRPRLCRSRCSACLAAQRKRQRLRSTASTCSTPTTSKFTTRRPRRRGTFRDRFSFACARPSEAGRRCRKEPCCTLCSAGLALTVPIAISPGFAQESGRTRARDQGDLFVEVRAVCRMAGDRIQIARQPVCDLRPRQ